MLKAGTARRNRVSDRQRVFKAWVGEALFLARWVHSDECAPTFDTNFWYFLSFWREVTRPTFARQIFFWNVFVLIMKPSTGLTRPLFRLSERTNRHIDFSSSCIYTAEEWKGTWSSFCLLMLTDFFPMLLYCVCGFVIFIVFILQCWGDKVPN